MKEKITLVCLCISLMLMTSCLSVRGAKYLNHIDKEWNTLQGRVVRITDGDSFTLLDKENNQHKIRLEGIDAPEKGQAFGKKSKQYLSDLIWDKRVTVRYKQHDRYGRIIGKISTSDTNDINLEMIRSGMAWHYSYYNKEAEYAKAETDARRKKVGLWIDKEPINPYLWRKEKKGKKKTRRFLPL